MARTRIIRPEHWDDFDLANISGLAHLLWIATWNFSDDEGVFENSPMLLKARIFPCRRNVTAEHIEDALKELNEYKFIIPFEYKGDNYFISKNFNRDQRVSKPSPSKIPREYLEAVLEKANPDKDLNNELIIHLPYAKN